MAALLIYSEKTPLALELLAAAKYIAQENAGEVKAVCVNDDGQAEALSGHGTNVFHIKNPYLNHSDTAAMAAALEQVVEKLSITTVILASNRRGKELAGRLAQKLQAGSLTDVNGLEAVGGEVKYRRNSLGGAVIAAQIITTEKQVLALAPRSFEMPAVQEGGQVQELSIDIVPSLLRVVESRGQTEDTADISEAEVLVIVGQGLEKDEIPLVENIASSLGAEIACSKPVATDKKWFADDRIVGLSGKICKPRLAMILGVSGQVQFTVGIREAHTIVVINNDENAYMVQMADYGWIADLKNALPELVKILC